MGRVCAINNIMQSIVRKIKVWNILFLNFLVTVNLFSNVQEKNQVDDIVDVNENDIQHVRDCLEKYFKNIKTAEIEFYCKSIKDGGKKFFTGNIFIDRGLNKILIKNKNSHNDVIFNENNNFYIYDSKLKEVTSVRTPEIALLLLRNDMSIMKKAKFFRKNNRFIMAFHISDILGVQKIIIGFNINENDQVELKYWSVVNKSNKVIISIKKFIVNHDLPKTVFDVKK